MTKTDQMSYLARKRPVIGGECAKCGKDPSEYPEYPVGLGHPTHPASFLP